MGVVECIFEKNSSEKIGVLAFGVGGEFVGDGVKVAAV